MLLSLLQRLTGIISEEQIMAQLLKSHPQYIQSIKAMPNITGSTSDQFVRREIMAQLRRGLDEAGLIDNPEALVSAASAEESFKSDGLQRRTSAAMGRRLSLTKSQTQAKEKSQMAARERHRTNSILAYMAQRNGDDDLTA